MTQLINIPLTKFKFIGIVEKYDEEIKRFKETFGIDINEESQHYNLNPEKKSVQETYNVSDEQKEKLMKLHAEDYKLYNECLKLAGYN
jgi:phosphate starvation-inducible protein PhoH